MHSQNEMQVNYWELSTISSKERFICFMPMLPQYFVTRIHCVFVGLQRINEAVQWYKCVSYKVSTWKTRTNYHTAFKITKGEERRSVLGAWKPCEVIARRNSGKLHLSNHFHSHWSKCWIKIRHLHIYLPKVFPTELITAAQWLASFVGP